MQVHKVANQRRKILIEYLVGKELGSERVLGNACKTQNKIVVQYLVEEMKLNLQD